MKRLDVRVGGARQSLHRCAPFYGPLQSRWIARVWFVETFSLKNPRQQPADRLGQTNGKRNWQPC